MNAHPTHVWRFGVGSGVRVAADQAELLIQLIADELSLPEMATLVELRRRDPTRVEKIVVPGSAVEGRAIAELDLPADPWWSRSSATQVLSG